MIAGWSRVFDAFAFDALYSVKSKSTKYSSMSACLYVLLPLPPCVLLLPMLHLRLYLGNVGTSFPASSLLSPSPAFPRSASFVFLLCVLHLLHLHFPHLLLFLLHLLALARFLFFTHCLVLCFHTPPQPNHASVLSTSSICTHMHICVCVHMCVCAYVCTCACVCAS